MTQLKEDLLIHSPETEFPEPEPPKPPHKPAKAKAKPKILSLLTFAVAKNISISKAA